VRFLTARVPLSALVCRVGDAIVAHLVGGVGGRPDRGPVRDWLRSQDMDCPDESTRCGLPTRRHMLAVLCNFRVTSIAVSF